MRRTIRRMLWVFFAFVLAGCGGNDPVIEITYPAQTVSAESTPPPLTEITAETEAETAESVPVHGDYVLNTSSKKFHDPSCGSVPTIKEKNREAYSGDRAVLIERGFAPCKRCNP